MSAYIIVFAASGRVFLFEPVLHLDVSVFKSFVLHLDSSAYKSFVLDPDVLPLWVSSYKSFVLHLDVSVYKSLYCPCGCLSTRALSAPGGVYLRFTCRCTVYIFLICFCLF